MSGRALRLVILGRQGSGKGTQCMKVATRFEIPHISRKRWLYVLTRRCRSTTRMPSAVASSVARRSESVFWSS